jgi:hypothetical protein
MEVEKKKMGVRNMDFGQNIYPCGPEKLDVLCGMK